MTQSPAIIATQTWGILLDAYREMNSRKMFWIVMILSALVMAAFATVGAGEHGLTFLAWTIPGGDRAGGQIVYKLIFSYLVVGLYLTWAATILALISTASIFPDFITGGAIDLYLSKPIGRTRLFLTKYISGLLFVTLQVTAFTFVSFLVLGFRGHIWQLSLFLAIPIVVTFFSYLFGICVLLGVLTRSTLLALLLTILAWFFFWGFDRTDMFLTDRTSAHPTSVIMAEIRIRSLDQQIAAIEKRISAAATASAPATEQGVTVPATGGGKATGTAAHTRSTPELEEALREMKAEREMNQRMLDDAKNAEHWMVVCQPIVAGIKTFMPKTRETTSLLDRYLFPDSELAATHDTDSESVAVFAENMNPTKARSAWWIIGSSLGFEACCVGLAAWIFRRRDF